MFQENLISWMLSVLLWERKHRVYVWNDCLILFMEPPSNAQSPEGILFVLTSKCFDLFCFPSPLCYSVIYNIFAKIPLFSVNNVLQCVSNSHICSGRWNWEKLPTFRAGSIFWSQNQQWGTIIHCRNLLHIVLYQMYSFQAIN